MTCGRKDTQWKKGEDPSDRKQPIMSRFGGRFFRVLLTAVLCAASVDYVQQRAAATELELKDGRTIKGSLGMIGSLANQLQAPNPGGAGPLQLIVMLDDDLRRTFISKRLVQEVLQDDPAQLTV